MSQQTGRTRRVAELLQQELGPMIQQELRDSRLKWVSIVRVDVAPDLKMAKVFYSLMPETEAAAAPEEIQAVLDHASGYLRGLLGRRVSLRHVPELTFVYDESLEYGDHMNRLLRSLDHGESDGD
ncbi:30S ribosome-binding factor RbfA [Thiohalorhabdus sp.]|uniref:30S ribosome-binding factor RbfA n=1 Tax=Thiohalorhabdus sp. TaxID=3094134 RepID=UPI002FC31272